MSVCLLAFRNPLNWMFNCLMLIKANRNYTGYPKAGHHMGENNMATWLSEPKASLSFAPSWATILSFQMDRDFVCNHVPKLNTYNHAVITCASKSHTQKSYILSPKSVYVPYDSHSKVKSLLNIGITIRFL